MKNEFSVLAGRNRWSSVTPNNSCLQIQSLPAWTSKTLVAFHFWYVCSSCILLLLLLLLFNNFKYNFQMHSIPVTDLFAHFVHNFQVSVGLQCLQHDQHLQVLWYLCCSHIFWFSKVYRLFTNHLVKLGTETMSTLLYLLTNHPANPSILGQVNTTKRPRLKEKTEDFLNSFLHSFFCLWVCVLSLCLSLARSFTHTHAHKHTHVHLRTYYAPYFCLLSYTITLI